LFTPESQPKLMRKMLSKFGKYEDTNKILKKLEWHFFERKNDILYTELNFANFWSSAP
jgi:hypothetical protein